MHVNTPPNILMIMTDQQRYDSLGCYGFREARTPNLDQLAAQGAVFEHCYVNNPICTPSRASIMTGKPLPGHRVYKLNDNLSEKEELFTVKLQQQGYETALFGKLHVNSRDFEANGRHPGDGFDKYEYCVDPYLDLDSPMNSYAIWLKENHPDFFRRLRQEGRRLGHFPQETHVARWTADRTIDFLNGRKSETPFFCLTSFFDPHDPYQDYPVEVAETMRGVEIPPPAKPDAEMRYKPEGIRREHEQSYFGPYPRLSVGDLERIRYGYHASIAFVDQQIGRVFRALKENGLWENTLILFVSDHGDMLGDRELLVKGAFFYEACTRVPLIVRFPDGRYAGERFSPVVQPHDIAATLLAQAGYPEGELADQMPDSIDLEALLRGDKQPRGYAVCMYRNSGIRQGGTSFDPPIHCTMFRDERYKLNVYHEPLMESSQCEGELFDMLEDPGETVNLWDRGEFQEVKARLMHRLTDWMVVQG